MLKETKKTRNKGKITIVLRKGTAILLALIMVLTVGVTDAKAATEGTVYGKENLDWLKDELDQIVDPVIVRSENQNNTNNTINNYYSAERIVKAVTSYNDGRITITYYDPKSNNTVIGYKDINCSLYSNGGNSWQCSYNLLDGDNMGSASKLKSYKIELKGNGLQKYDNYSVSIVNGTKTITEQDYFYRFYRNIKREKDNSELIQTVTVKTYNVVDGVETLTKTNVTRNKDIEKIMTRM